MGVKVLLLVLSRNFIYCSYLIQPMSDPYEQRDHLVSEAPSSLWRQLKYLGPGFILSASIVGSGELIATTTLGARAGFVTFWIILMSCLIKVCVQLEFGRYTIIHARTPMEAFNGLPGKKLGKAHWSIWTFFVLMVFKILQVGGVLGGVAIILHMLAPALPMGVCAFFIAVIVALMIFKGYYTFIEKFSLSMIVLFTLFTFVCLYFLKYTDYSVTLDDVFSGLQFALPKEAVGVAIAAFGITGVGGDEIIAYNYWCLEKGYAAKAGAYDNSRESIDRIKGWTRVMYVDAVTAMIVYTTVTAAFYLLGAAVLHAAGTVPEGYEMVNILATMYTESLGPGARVFFMVGAFMVLFSTLFAALAAWTRQFSDIFGQLGWMNFRDENDRKKSIAYLSWTFPFLWAAMFLFIKLPVLMILIGGVVTSLILLLVIWVVVHFRYRRTPPVFHPSMTYDLILWLSIVSTVLIATYGIVKLLF